MITSAAFLMLLRAQEIHAAPLTVWYFGPDGHAQAMQNFSNDRATVYVMKPNPWSSP